MDADQRPNLERPGAAAADGRGRTDAEQPLHPARRGPAVFQEQVVSSTYATCKLDMACLRGLCACCNVWILERYGCYYACPALNRLLACVSRMPCSAACTEAVFAQANVCVQLQARHQGASNGHGGQGLELWERCAWCRTQRRCRPCCTPVQSSNVSLSLAHSICTVGLLLVLPKYSAPTVKGLCWHLNLHCCARMCGETNTFHRGGLLYLQAQAALER